MPQVKSTNPKGVRKVVTDHLTKRPNICRDDNNAPGCWDPIFVLKPNESSKYQNLVDILDEMRISNVPKYALGDMTALDSMLLKENDLE